MAAPAPVPLLSYPRWLRASALGGGDGWDDEDPPDQTFDEWVDGMRALFAQPEDKRTLRDMLKRNVTVTVFDRIYCRDLSYENGAWVEYDAILAGETSGTSIELVRKNDSVSGARTLVHENVHTKQPDSMTTLEAETEAYTVEAEWVIAHRISSAKDGITMREGGREVPDSDGIRRRIFRDYPGLVDAGDGTQGGGEDVPEEIEEIVEIDGDEVVVRGPNGEYRRAPRDGDTFPGSEVKEPPGGVVLDLRRLL